MCSEAVVFPLFISVVYVCCIYCYVGVSFDGAYFDLFTITLYNTDISANQSAWPLELDCLCQPMLSCHHSLTKWKKKTVV